MLPTTQSDGVVVTTNNPAAVEGAAATVVAALSSDDAASLRTYARAKTFVTVAPAWILGEPTLTPGVTLQIRRLEAGDSFTASAEMVVDDGRMGTAPAGAAAGAASTAPSTLVLRVCLGAEEAATHGWVAEEDETGSVVCVDLSYCLKPPISKICAGRSNIHFDGYFQIKAPAKGKKESKLYPELHKVVDHVEGRVHTIDAPYYKLSGKAKEVCLGGMVVKALGHKAMAPSKSAFKSPSCRYRSYVRTSRGWVLVCDSASPREATASAWTVTPLSSSKLVQAAGGGQFQYADSRWEQLQQFHPALHSFIRYSCIVVPAITLLIFIALQKNNHKWVDSNPWSYALGLAPFALLVFRGLQTCCASGAVDKSDAQDGIVVVEGKTIRYKPAG